MYRFEQLKLSATYSLMAKMQLEFRVKICSVLLLFILLKKIWLNLWFVTALCNTPVEFSATIPVSVRPMLFATMATLNCVDVFGMIYVLYF